MRRALSLLLIALAPVYAPVQTPVVADTPLLGAPTGPSLGTLKRGADVRTGATAGNMIAVTFEGWITSTRVSARRDSLDRTVTGRGAVPLRASGGASNAMVAELEPGTNLKKLSERNGWTQVRRTAWVRTSAVKVAAPQRAVTPPAQRPKAPQPERSAPAAAPTAAGGPVATVASGAATSQSDSAAQRTVRATALRASPGGEERATIRAGAGVETIARDNGWVRIRLEGWVPERDLVAADSSHDVRLSAADVRGDPSGSRGKIVRWEVQVIAVQKADPLRRSLALDEPYLLARGPGDEGAILYVALPPKLVDQVRALPPLSTVLITARVRDGKSSPTGAPLLDLISFTKAP